MRASLVVLISCLLGVNCAGPARSQTLSPATDSPGASIARNTPSRPCSSVTDNRTITTLGDVLSCISPYADGPEQTKNYYLATDALIRFIDRIDHVDYCAGPREARFDLISKMRQINQAVNTALSTPKDADYWVLDRDDPYPILLPYKNRIITPAFKSRKMSESDVKIELIATILSDYENRYTFGAESQDRKLFELAEEVLNAGNELFLWGMDAFLTSARGYAVYQVVRNCAAGRHVSSGIARAYAARTAAESEQYFYAQLDRLEAHGPDRPSFHRWQNEKTIIEGGEGSGGGFPKEIYLGTNIPSLKAPVPSEPGRPTDAESEERRCPDERSFQNWYGTLGYSDKIWENYPAPTDSGFSLDRESIKFACEERLNAKNYGAISALMTARLRELVPTSGLTGEIAQSRLRSIVDRINGHIARITFEKLREECLIDPTKECPQAPGGSFGRSGEGIVRQIRSEKPLIEREFGALGAMAQAMKDILARRPLE